MIQRKLLSDFFQLYWLYSVELHKYFDLKLMRMKLIVICSKRLIGRNHGNPESQNVCARIKPVTNTALFYQRQKLLR